MVVGSPIVLNLIPGGVMPVMMINETDKGYKKEFLIYNGAAPYNLPANVSATIRGTKRDGYGVTEEAEVTSGSNLVRITVTEQMTAVPGPNIFELVFEDTNNLKVATINFIMMVERSALNANTVISDSDIAYANQVLDQLQSVAAFKAQLDNASTDITELKNVKIQRFDTVEQMKADADLKAGMYARTGGYYAVNDGGGALYRIYSTTPSTYYETLSNGLYAELINSGAVNVKQFGAHGDGTHDDTVAFTNAVATGSYINIPAGTYIISSTITIPNNGCVVGLDKNFTRIESQASITFSFGEGVTFKNFYANGASDKVFAHGNGYRLRINNCVFNGYDIAIDCTAGLMLADIRNSRFRMLNKAFSIKGTSTACIFDNLWCGYTNTFISCDKSGLTIIEAYNLTNCTFEGTGTSTPKIRIFESTSSNRFAPRDIKFMSCYFESNGKIFGWVTGCTADFDSCWFFYTMDHGSEYYLDPHNENINFPAKISLNNCNMSPSEHGDILIGESVNMDYYVHNVMLGRWNITSKNYLTTRIYFENNGFVILYEQTEEIPSGGSVSFSVSPLSDFKRHTYLISIVGAYNANITQALYALYVGVANAVLVPIISKYCTMTLSGSTVTFTNDYSSALAVGPISFVATRLG